MEQPTILQFRELSLKEFKIAMADAKSGEIIDKQFNDNPYMLISDEYIRKDNPSDDEPKLIIVRNVNAGFDVYKLYDTCKPDDTAFVWYKLEPNHSK